MSSIPPLQPTPEPQGTDSKSAATRSEDPTFSNLLSNQIEKGSLSRSGSSPIGQLSFLQLPVKMNLPAFMASRWQPKTGEASAGPATGASKETRAAQQLFMDRAASGLGFVPTVKKPEIRPTDRVGSPSSIQGAGVNPMPLSAFPKPAGDTGRGIHWIPTVSQTPEVIDRYLNEAQEMGIKWITFLNEGTKTGANDYLVKEMEKRGIEPVMRLYTDGGAPLEGDIQATVRHYKSMGVDYFQVYNEPNLRLENQGKAPDPEAYAQKWLDAAREVVKAGGLPGFASLSPTPGLAPGAAPGDMDDLAFLRRSLQEVKKLGGGDVMDRTWLSVHNYGQEHLRIRDYDAIVRQELGRSLPQVGTEAGIYPGDTLSPEAASQIVGDAYRYLPQREDYYFAYTYWIIANDPGTGHVDGAWNHQALFRPDGQSPLVDLLKREAA